MTCPDTRRAARLGLAFVALGLACRLLRYGLDFPLWGDEASLALNLAARDYAGLADELEHFQVAPLLFLWAQKAALGLLGDSEWALRLLPLLAGLAALVLFWRVARDLLPPTAAALAVGLLAAARWPVTMSASVKPYSLDLLASLVLLALAAAWRRRPRRGRLALLAAAAPLAVGLSYPAVFVAGGVSLALLPEVWRRRRGQEWALYAIFNVLLVAAFLTTLLLVARPRPGAPDLRGFMADYWRAGFPPAEWHRLPLWLASAHTGQMFAYPIGAAHGGSVLTLALFAAGVAWCWRQGRRELLALCLLPFALHLAAAALHRYPYGASGRLAQHLAPAICLLAGAGLAWVVEQRPRAVAAAAGLFVACGVGGMAADIARPYRDPLARWSRQTARDAVARHAAGERLVIEQAPEEIMPTLRWHLRRAGPAVAWGGGGGPAWRLDVRRDDGSERSEYSVILHNGPERWRCTLYPPHVAASRASQPRSVAAR